MQFWSFRRDDEHDPLCLHTLTTEEPDAKKKQFSKATAESCFFAHSNRADVPKRKLLFELSAIVSLLGSWHGVTSPLPSPLRKSPNIITYESVYSPRSNTRHQQAYAEREKENNQPDRLFISHPHMCPYVHFLISRVHLPNELGICAWWFFVTWNLCSSKDSLGSK